MTPLDTSTIELRGVSRTSARKGDGPAAHVDGVDLRIARQTCTWLSGDSEASRDLLFHLLSLGEKPDCGEVLIEGHSPLHLGPAECADFRAHKFGFVAAAPFLIPTFSAIENIAVPLMKISHLPLEEAQTRIANLLQFVSLTEKAEVPATALTAFEQASLVLGRALSNVPVVLFVEDLSASLSSLERLHFAQLLRRSCTRYGVSVVACEGAVRQAVFGDCRIHVTELGVEQTEATGKPVLS